MTRTFRCIAMAGSLVIGGATMAFAQGAAVAGVWKGTMETQIGPMETTIRIDTAAPLVGSVQVGDYSGTIENGKVDGDRITFAVTLQPGTMAFDGVVAGDEMRLNVTGTTGNKMTLVARRQKPPA